MKKIVNGLYILIMAALFILAGWSFLFGGLESSLIEDMVLMIFVAVLSIVMICTVLMDDDDENDDGGEKGC